MLTYINVVPSHIVKLLYSDEDLTGDVAVWMLAVGSDAGDSGSTAAPWCL